MPWVTFNYINNFIVEKQEVLWDGLKCILGQFRTLEKISCVLMFTIIPTSFHIWNTVFDDNLCVI